MSFYVDTSVIIAALDPLDYRQRLARQSLERDEVKIVSELVLAELASALSRREKLVRDMARRLNLDEGLTVMAVILYLMKKFRLRYRGLKYGKALTPYGMVYKPIATALELAPTLRLKTLDLLHIAYAKLLKEEGEPIHALVTADKEFERAKKHLRDITGIELHLIQ